MESLSADVSASFQSSGAGGADPQALLGRLRFDAAGLIPAVAQDWLDGAVLMVAWMNREAIERTLASGEVHYWSRSTPDPAPRPVDQGAGKIRSCCPESENQPGVAVKQAELRSFSRASTCQQQLRPWSRS